jgi:hypothetical protein
MSSKYDPERRRSYWLKFGLKIEDKFEPPADPSVCASYVEHAANGIIDAILVGLVDEVRPKLNRVLDWMESHPEPDQMAFSDFDAPLNKWCYALYQWRATLGMCRWLTGASQAERSFAQALEAQRLALGQSDPQRVAWARADLRDFMTLSLALAVAGKVPVVGLKLFEAAEMKRPPRGEAPIVRFGRWACQHLSDGGARDATFVGKGKEMLTASLLPKYFAGGEKVEPALWLKAIYFDSGIAKTPEQAIAMAYDSMPGVARPDFV